MLYTAGICADDSESSSHLILHNMSLTRCAATATYDIRYTEQVCINLTRWENAD